MLCRPQQGSELIIINSQSKSETNEVRIFIKDGNVTAQQLLTT